MIVIPQFFALDSAHLGEIARDAAARKSKVHTYELLNKLAKNGWFLVLSWHHITELIQHRDDGLVDDRLRFIRRLPAIAWIRSYRRELNIGAITDLFAHEVGVAISGEAMDCIEVARKVRDNVFDLGTGELAVNQYEELWEFLRATSRDRQKRKREIASLARTAVFDDASESLRPFFEGRLRSRDSASKKLESLMRILTEGLEAHGDNKIPDPAKTAKAFFDEVAQDGESLYDHEGSPMAAYLNQFGIKVSQLDLDGPRQQLYDLIEFQQKLRVLDGQMRVPWEELSKTDPDLIPSWQIQRACRLHPAPAARAKGSDIDDMHIACISPYCDRTFVDKRTYESFRRTTRKNSRVKLLSRSIRKAKSYQEAIKQVLSV